MLFRSGIVALAGGAVPLGAFNVTKANIAGLKSAVNAAQNGTGRLGVAFCEDSTGFGIGSSPGTNVDNALWALGPKPQLAKRLSAAGIPTKCNSLMGFGADTMNNYGNSGNYDGVRVVTGSWNTTRSTFGGFGATIAVTGSQFTFTPKDADGNAQPFDRVDVVSMNPAAGNSILVRANSATKLTISNNAGLATDAPRVDTATCNANSTAMGLQAGSAASVYFIGLMTYAAAETSMFLVGGGWPGSTSTDWTVNPTTYGPIMVIPVLYTMGVRHLFINLTINGENGQETLTQFATAHQTLIDAAKNAGMTVTLVVGGPTAPNPPEATHTSLTVQMTYWQKIYDLATLNGLSVLDLTIAIGSYDYAANTLGIMYDVSHLTAAGYANYRAKAYADFIAYAGVV